MVFLDNKIKNNKNWNNSNEFLKQLFSNNWYKILTKLQNEFIVSTIQFYSDLDYRFLMLPTTTNTVSSPMGLGSDSKPVKINLRGRDIYLIDSAQFYLEIGCRIHKNGVYYIAPSFRGEATDERHLDQFFHSEVEIIGELDDIMDLGERYIKYLIMHFLKTCDEEIAEIAGGIEHLKIYENIGSFARIPFNEAYTKLESNLNFVSNKNGIRTITSIGERELIKMNKQALWLTNFEHKAVPFYQAYTDQTHELALNADLLVGSGEILGCGQRHYSSTDTLQALFEHKISRENYDWYIKMKDLIPMQTSGFGLGVERFFLFLLNYKDIRDIQLIPTYDGININL